MGLFASTYYTNHTNFFIITTKNTKTYNNVELLISTYYSNYTYFFITRIFFTSKNAKGDERIERFLLGIIVNIQCRDAIYKKYNDLYFFQCNVINKLYYIVAWGVVIVVVDVVVDMGGYYGC